MSTLSKRAAGLVEGWPPGGLVVGLLPDPSEPPWAGRAALALARATAALRKPALILDLAPKDTDLASRFGAADETGFAELVEGEVRLWEIVHRYSGGEAFYVPCGLRAPGNELARSPAARTLADRVRDAGRILLVPLDRRGAGEAASAGWVDGFVRLGNRTVSSARLSGDAATFGHLERRGSGADPPVSAGDGAAGARERAKGRRRGSGAEPREGEPPGNRGTQRSEVGRSSPRLALPRRRRSSHLLRRTVRAVLGAAALIAAGLTASSWLGGPGWQEVREATGTVTGAAERIVPPPDGPGEASADSTVGPGDSLASPTSAADSSSSPAPPESDSGNAPPR